MRDFRTPSGDRVPKNSNGAHHGSLRQGAATVSRYEYIDSCRNGSDQTNPVYRMCGWLAVSTLGFTTG